MTTFKLEDYEHQTVTSHRLGRHPRTLSEWAKKGVLPPPQKFRGRWYFPKNCQPAAA